MFLLTCERYKDGIPFDFNSEAIKRKTAVSGRGTSDDRLYPRSMLLNVPMPGVDVNQERERSTHQASSDLIQNCRQTYITQANVYRDRCARMALASKALLRRRLHHLFRVNQKDLPTTLLTLAGTVARRKVLSTAMVAY